MLWQKKKASPLERPSRLQQMLVRQRLFKV